MADATTPTPQPTYFQTLPPTVQQYITSAGFNPSQVVGTKLGPGVILSGAGTSVDIQVFSPTGGGTGGQGPTYRILRSTQLSDLGIDTATQSAISDYLTQQYNASLAAGLNTGQYAVITSTPSGQETITTYQQNQPPITTSYTSPVSTAPVTITPVDPASSQAIGTPQTFGVGNISSIPSGPVPNTVISITPVEPMSSKPTGPSTNVLAYTQPNLVPPIQQQQTVDLSKGITTEQLVNVDLNQIASNYATQIKAGKDVGVTLLPGETISSSGQIISFEQNQRASQFAQAVTSSAQSGDIGAQAFSLVAANVFGMKGIETVTTAISESGYQTKFNTATGQFEILSPPKTAEQIAFDIKGLQFQGLREYAFISGIASGKNPFTAGNILSVTQSSPLTQVAESAIVGYGAGLVFREIASIPTTSFLSKAASSIKGTLLGESFVPSIKYLVNNPAILETAGIGLIAGTSIVQAGSEGPAKAFLSGAELTAFSGGLSGGLKSNFVQQAKDLIGGKSVIPLQEMTPRDVITSETTFPKPFPGETGGQFVQQIKSQEFIPQELRQPGKIVVYSATGTPGGLLEGEPIGSAAPRSIREGSTGIYGSPQLSVNFLRVSGEEGIPKLSIGAERPTVLAIGAEDIGRIPKNILEQAPSASVKFLTEDAKQDVFYVTRAFEKGKPELEVSGGYGATLENVNPNARFGYEYYTEYKNTHVPVFEVSLKPSEGSIAMSAEEVNNLARNAISPQQLPSYLESLKTAPISSFISGIASSSSLLSTPSVSSSPSSSSLSLLSSPSTSSSLSSISDPIASSSLSSLSDPISPSFSPSPSFTPPISSSFTPSRSSPSPSLSISSPSIPSGPSTGTPSRGPPSFEYPPPPIFNSELFSTKKRRLGFSFKRKSTKLRTRLLPTSDLINLGKSSPKFGQVPHLAFGPKTEKAFRYEIETKGVFATFPTFEQITKRKPKIRKGVLNL